MPEYFADRIDCFPLEDLMNEVYATTQDQSKFNVYVGSLHFHPRYEFSRHGSRLRQITFSAGPGKQATDFVGYLASITTALINAWNDEGEYVRCVGDFGKFITMLFPKNGEEFQRIANEETICRLLDEITRFRQRPGLDLYDLLIMLGALLSPSFDPSRYPDINYGFIVSTVLSLRRWFHDPVRMHHLNCVLLLAPYTRFTEEMVDDLVGALGFIFLDPNDELDLTNDDVFEERALLLVVLGMAINGDGEQDDEFIRRLKDHSSPRTWISLCAQLLETWEPLTSSTVVECSEGTTGRGYLRRWPHCQPARTHCSSSGFLAIVAE